MTAQPPLTSGAMFLAVALLVSGPSAAFAARIGTIEIRVDGKVLLRGSTHDNGAPPPSVVWRYLSRPTGLDELRPEPGVEIVPDAGDPLRATLKGKIVVEVQFAGKAEVSELRLVRKSPSAGWSVAEEDVARMANGMNLSTVPGLPEVVGRPAASAERAEDAGEVSWPWVIAGAVGVVLAAGIAALCFRSRLRRTDGHAAGA